MIGLIPVFFGDNESLWRNDEDGPLLAHSFEAIRQSSGLSRTIVVSDKSWVLDLARKYSFEVLATQVRDMDDTRFLPLGTMHAVQRLGQEEVVSERLLVLEFRNILKDGGVIDKAVCQAIGSGDPGMSVVKSVDHPCQLKSHFRFVDVVLVHLFDRSEEAQSIVAPFVDENAHDEWEVSQPIYFNWAFKGVNNSAPGSYYRRCYEGVKPHYERIKPDYDVKAPVWFMESEVEARVLSFQKPKPEISIHSGGRLVGSTVSDRREEGVLLLYRDEAGTFSLCMNPKQDPCYRVLLRMMPLGPEGPRVEKLCELFVGSFEDGIKLPFDDDDLCGVIVAMIEVVEDGAYDMSDAFRPSENLWIVDNAMSEAFLPDGTPIAGRQDFPDVFEPDGTFFVVAPEDICRFDELIDAGMVRGVHLEESDVVRVESEFDVLRLKAALEAESIC